MYVCRRCSANFKTGEGKPDPRMHGLGKCNKCLEAAQAARNLRVEVIAGAPNIVRGGSHSGNVAAADLVREGLAHAFASDYVPASMLEAAWRAVDAGGITLPQAIAMVADTPARMARLTDRGRLAAGLKADLVRVRSIGDMPLVRGVWRAGERIA